MNEKIRKIIKIAMEIIAVLIISVFAYSITPKTLQNDTYYTVKIGEHIQNSVSSVFDLLPWNKGLDMQDPFSFHENLPYTYPHWLYDLITYKIFCIGGFQAIYIATCISAIILGLLIYFINKKMNKNTIVSFTITIASLYCLKGFIAARAQLVTFILFVLTVFGIEQFIKSKKIRYAVLLIIIPILIANLHSAVWPFYFVLYLPYIAEYLIYTISTKDYRALLKKISLKMKKKKLDEIQYNIEKNRIDNLQKMHNERVESKLSNTYKIRISREKNVKWLILIVVICLFTGLLTPIKDTPYTYLIKTTQGNTTQNISEHLPLTLINNTNVMVILVIIFGILTFTKTKISLRNFFMIMGLIFLSFMSQRQVSMLVIIGNFIIAKMICEWLNNINKNRIKNENAIYYASMIFLIIVILTSTISMKYYVEKNNNPYIDESSYPVQASDYLVNELIPEVGIENLKLYNEYNYGSYLLYRGIPVFIDSRADLYTPEFNGEKNEDGEYNGRDIFTDFLNISSLSSSYESEFENYGITHVITYSNSKLNSLISKDSNYNLLYEDGYFSIYERESAKMG
jgi:hypothetical protein